MLYNNTSSVNYLEFDKLTTNASSITVSAPITASFVSGGFTGFLDLDYFGIQPIATSNVNVLAPNTTAETVLRTIEIPNSQLSKNNVYLLQYFRLEQNGNTGNNKTWRIYVNSTSSLAGATLINTATRTTSNLSNAAAGNFYKSGSEFFYFDSTGEWDSNNRVTFNYDIVSSSIWIISTLQKAVGGDTIREHYGFVFMQGSNTIEGEVFPL